MDIIIAIAIIVGCAFALLGLHILKDKHNCRRSKGCDGSCDNCPYRRTDG